MSRDNVTVSDEGVITYPGMNVSQFVEENIDYLSGYLDIDDSLSDGAWWHTLEYLSDELIKSANVKNFDGNDMVHEFLKQKKD